MSVKPLEWHNDKLRLLDQRELPHRVVWLELDNWRDVENAIQTMAVRGAPAIGIAAAYGMALAAKHGDNWQAARKGLANSRPTAVNLFWALERLDLCEDKSPANVLAQAQLIEREDLKLNLAIASHGLALVPDSSTALTICNTGSLATGGHGTALGILKTAYAHGKLKFVYSCETRPRLQGLKLTTWELIQDSIPFAAIADSAAGTLMHSGVIDFVVVGADRIAANGDTANKIGTYSLAVLARHHKIPFYVAAPSTTIDPKTPGGACITIEERPSSELTEIDGIHVAPPNCPVFNPAFDVTPGTLISAIISESGVYHPPFDFAS